MSSLAAHIQRVPQFYTDSSGDYDWKTHFAFIVQLLVWGGEKDAFALPLADEAMVCCYRAICWRMSARAEFKTRYGRELKPPATWQDITRIASSSNKPRPGMTRLSSPPLPKDDDGLDRMPIWWLPFVRHAAVEDRKAAASLRNLFSFHYDLDSRRSAHQRVCGPGVLTKLHSLEIRGRSGASFGQWWL